MAEKNWCLSPFVHSLTSSLHRLPSFLSYRLLSPSQPSQCDRMTFSGHKKLYRDPKVHTHSPYLTYFTSEYLRRKLSSVFFLLPFQRFFLSVQTASIKFYGFSLWSFCLFLSICVCVSEWREKETNRFFHTFGSLSVAGYWRQFFPGFKNINEYWMSLYSEWVNVREKWRKSLSEEIKRS